MAWAEDRWRVLRDYTESIASGTAVNVLVEQTLATALTVLRASSASLSRFELERGRVKILHNVGELADWEVPWPEESYYILSEYTQLMSTVGGSARSWSGSLDNPATAGPDRDLLTRVGKRHSASFRIRVADKIWGDLYVTRAEGKPFDDEDLEVGEVLVGLTSSGLSRQELLADLADLAYTDPLTSVGNRRAADEWLEEKLSKDHDAFVPVAAVLCDVNGLKRINDSLGHTAGDELLRIAAGNLTTAVEGTDDVLVARLGGDEFLILIGDVEQHQVKSIEKRLADLRLPYGAGLAVGAATTMSRPDPSESPKTAARALLRLADAAQYRHKQTKRVASKPMLVPALPLTALLPIGAAEVVQAGLDGFAECGEPTPVWRLQVACNAVGATYDVTSWWVSRHRDGKLVDVLGCVLRPDARGALSGVEFTSGTPFNPAYFPATEAALEGGSYYASLTEGDPIERAFLARMGYLATLAAGETSANGDQWLVELFADTQTSSGLFAAEPALRALVHMAVRGAIPDHEAGA